jgi:Spy/CpxP family protein refolding chaperone
MKNAIIVSILVLICARSFAQQNAGSDPIMKSLFSPEIIMQNQQVINLSEAQRNSISKEMQNAQTEFMTLQWDLSKETEKFAQLIAKEKPVEADVTEQLDRMLFVESKIKKKQIALLVRIKAILTNEQQAKLQKLKA